MCVWPTPDPSLSVFSFLFSHSLSSSPLHPDLTEQMMPHLVHSIVEQKRTGAPLFDAHEQREETGWAHDELQFIIILSTFPSSLYHKIIGPHEKPQPRSLSFLSVCLCQRAFRFHVMESPSLSLLDDDDDDHYDESKGGKGRFLESEMTTLVHTSQGKERIVNEGLLFSFSCLHFPLSNTARSTCIIRESYCFLLFISATPRSSL